MLIKQLFCDLNRAAPVTNPFDYIVAFSRNIGWLSVQEQERLKKARVAIAGLGGVGGSHLLTLARLGVEKFNIADFDYFELQNFNRQAGATLSNIGQAKTSVLARMAQDINPDLELRVFPDGVRPDNVDTFLDNVDIYVDGIDFFAIEARRLVFAACHQRGVPAVTAAPLGMGAALLYFKPGGMSFEDYFRLEGQSRQEQLAHFIVGLAPRMLQQSYLVEPGAVNFREERGPSTAMACDLCAGMMGSEVLKILLKRGPVRSAPWGIHYDAYRQKLAYTWRPFGNANPLQRLLLGFIRRRLSNLLP
ncbi:MAG: ThiF family adenylyltransferase [Candidatus Competibacter sp.]|nr:ThiF family adenylyltransferase [Candidatus Competibacter sp.]